MVSRLQNHIGYDWATQLQYSIAIVMFPTKYSNVFECEAMLQVFVNEWVDLTIVFWFISYFYEVYREKLNNDFLADTAFLNDPYNDSFLEIGLTAFEETQTQIV
ncbi:hypothetical protein R6Q59_018648 [Mikania micrantha]